MDEGDRRRLREIFRRYPEAEAVYAFGSRSRGTARPDSDLDLAVVPAGPEARSRRLDMLADLAAAGFDDVDLVILDGDDPVLEFEAITPNDLVHAADGHDRAEAVVRALRRYWDVAPLLEVQRRAFLERLLEDGASRSEASERHGGDRR